MSTEGTIRFLDAHFHLAVIALFGVVLIAGIGTLSCYTLGPRRLAPDWARAWTLSLIAFAMAVAADVLIGHIAHTIAT